MTTRRRNLLVLAGVLALAIAGAFVFAPASRQRAAIEAVPEGAFLVVTVDVAKLRESPLMREASTLHEVSDVSEECGFDPLTHVQSIALGVPEKPDGVFGIAVTNDLAEKDLAHCAERVMGARSATPRFTKHGSWTVLEQEGVITEATRPKIAYRDGSPLLIARGDYLATMQAAIDGTTKRADTSTDHAALRKIATDRSADHAILIATAVLPKSLRDRLKDEMSDEAESSETRKQTMAAILSVGKVALAVSGHGDSLDVFIELDCESEAACGTVRDFLDRKRKSVAATTAARFTGIAGLLEAIHAEVHGGALDLTLSAPESEIVRAIRAVLSGGGAPDVPTQGDGGPGFSPRR